MKVNIFIPCFVDQLFPQTAFNMIAVLEKAGVEVIYNPAQTCCGQPAFNAGFWEDAKAVSKKFINDFSEARYVVMPSASCAGFVRNYYGKLFGESSTGSGISDTSKKVFEFTEFLTEILKIKIEGVTFRGKAVYHDSCAALRECGIKAGPRQLLAHVKGLELVEMQDTETCCGFGGTFSVKYEPISVAMAEQKVQHALDAGAEYIISTDLSCLMQLGGVIKNKGLNLKTAHIADVLAARD